MNPTKRLPQEGLLKNPVPTGFLLVKTNLTQQEHNFK